MELSNHKKYDFPIWGLVKGKTNWLAVNGLLIIFLFFLSSCGIYSFTGASIPPGAKTVSVQYFPNKAALVEPTLSETFTNALRDIFINQTNLKMVGQHGDLALEGEIINYAITPEAIQGNQTAALDRLTITIKARFVNRLDPAKDFESQFTQYKEYRSTDNFNSIKSNLIKQIADNLAENIFNKAVVNW